MLGNSNAIILEEKDFENKTEEEIVAEAKEGNSLAQEIIINRYEAFIRGKSDLIF